MATFTVSENGPYSTINSALADAITERNSSGQVQTIVVYPKSNNGAYYEQIDLTVDGIQINGIVQGVNRVRVLGYYKYENDGVSDINGGRNVLTRVDMYRVIFTGLEYQNLVMADVRLNNSVDHTIEFTNTGFGGVYSYITINGGSFTNTNPDKNSLYMTNGYLYANNVQFIHNADSVSVYCTANDFEDAGSRTGIEISTGSFVGQFDFELDAPVNDEYTNLNLYNVSIRTEGPGFAPIKIRKSKAILSGVTLVNPQTIFTIDTDTDSRITYKNIIVPAGGTTLPVGEIARSRIAADIAGAGGIVVNDDQGRLSTLLGTINGQSAVWNAFSNRWEAVFASNVPTYSFEVSDASTWVVGDCVSLVGGSLVLGGYVDQPSSDCVGIVTSIIVQGDGPSAVVTVALAGPPSVSTDLTSFGMGEEVYVGLNGKLVPYSGIPEGSWITLVGKVIDNGTGAGSGKLALNIRQVGTK